MLLLFIVSLVFSSIISDIRGQSKCTFSRSTKIIPCANQQCSANTDDTPAGFYKVGAVEWNSGKDRYWMNLYPQKKSGNGYWDYYCENPDTGRSKIGLHPGSVSLGCISVPDSNCWSKLKTWAEQRSRYSFPVTGVTRSGIGSLVSFSCNGGWVAGDPIKKNCFCHWFAPSY